MEVIYETPKHIFPFETAILFFLSLFLLYSVVKLIVEQYKDREFNMTSVLFIIGGLIVAGIILNIGIKSYIETGGDEMAKYSRQYYAGEFLEVEGIVEDYVYYKGSEAFTVCGTVFSYRTTDGVNGFYDSGKRIEKNGIHVRIRYIEENRMNIIMKVEIEE
ncbi:MAG: hypothetical protein PUE84_07970 [Firmicutes bacterium]|nr:hypothetical protein [Bacillota bacterium]